MPQAFFFCFLNALYIVRLLLTVNILLLFILPECVFYAGLALLYITQGQSEGITSACGSWISMSHRDAPVIFNTNDLITVSYSVSMMSVDNSSYVPSVLHINLVLCTCYGNCIYWLVDWLG